MIQNHLHFKNQNPKSFCFLTIPPEVPSGSDLQTSRAAPKLPSFPAQVCVSEEVRVVHIPDPSTLNLLLGVSEG